MSCLLFGTLDSLEDKKSFWKRNLVFTGELYFLQAFWKYEACSISIPNAIWINQSFKVG
jgi:hypothetical protein